MIASRRDPLPWVLALGSATIVTLGAAFAPFHAGIAILALGTAGFLLWRYGGRLGSWYLFLILLPIREPLGFDIVGTTTIPLGDFVLYALLAVIAWENGFRDLWRRSPILRIGVVILLLSAIGLYGSPLPRWGIAALRRIFGQVAIFYVARHLVRTGEHAVTSLVVFLAGMIPAILYGFYQSTTPVELTNYEDWRDTALAFEATGEARVRVTSTYDNPLHFSQGLSMAVGMCVGLWHLPLRRIGRALLLAIGAAAAMCNQYTYSVSGILSTLAAGLTGLSLGRRRWLAVVFTLLLVLSIAAAPAALVDRVTGLMTGSSISGVVRIITYQQGFRAFLDHPVLGLGWGGISRLSGDEYQMSWSRAVAPAPENYFFYRLVALGIPGLALYVLLLGLFLRNCFAPLPGPEGAAGIPWPRAAILAAAAGFYVHGMLIPDGGASNNYMLWLLFAISETMRERSRRS